MELDSDDELGAAQRRFDYHSGRAGLFLVGLVGAPLVALGLIAAVALPLTAGRELRFGDTAGGLLAGAMCLLFGGFFVYYFWSIRQISRYRTSFYTVYERGLVHSMKYDVATGHPGVPRLAVAPWASVVEVVEQQKTSLLAKWLLPPTFWYRATVVLRDGDQLTFTGVTRDARELAAIVRAQSGLGPAGAPQR